jgi:hypothetical protein
MATLDAHVRQTIDDIANALQAVVLIAEHLKRASSATAQDAEAMIRNLRRVTDSLERLRMPGGAL